VNLLTLDYELYYDKDYNLDKLTTEEFVRDPRFEVQCVGLKFGRHKAGTVHANDFRENAHKIDWANTAVVSHHAHFESLILWHHYGLRPGFWFDTLSMARYLFSGEVGLNLRDLTRYLGVTPKGTIPPEVKGLRLSMMPESVYAALASYCADDCEGEFEAFEIMCPQIPERELGLIDLTVRMFGEPVLVINEPFLREYAEWEEAKRAQLVASLGKTPSDFRSTAKFSQILVDAGVPESELPVGPNDKGELRRTFKKDHPWMQAQLEQPEGDLIGDLCRARVVFASSIRQSRTRRLLASGAGGRPVPVYLNYHKAGPGRWSGGDKMNFQNLDRVKRRKTGRLLDNGKPEMETVYGTGMMRRALRAPDGYELVVADSSQIEARDNAYHAGQRDIVDAFARGEDIYSLFASGIYGRHVDRKKNPDDELPGFVGKVSILGLGYGMGWPKFASELLRGMMGADPVLLGTDTLEALNANVGKFMNNPKNIEKVRAIITRHPWDKLMIHCICSWEIVNRYRERSDKIVEYWETCERALDHMIAGREFCFGYNGSIHTERNAIVLPSGRRIRYPDLERVHGKYRYRDPEERSWTYIYGGKTCENVTQGDCRDLVAYPMLDLSRQMKIATMSHDEIVGVTPLGTGKVMLPVMIERMRQAPPTHPGLPLNAEGGVGIYYGDAK
jgi:DNA polymerase